MQQKEAKCDKFKSYIKKKKRSIKKKNLTLLIEISIQHRAKKPEET